MEYEQNDSKNMPLARPVTPWWHACAVADVRHAEVYMGLFPVMIFMAMAVVDAGVAEMEVR